MIEEIQALKKRGHLKDDGQLLISEEAHLILPYHRKIDVARERIFKIGTTGRGIGPAYEDKVGRCGIRMVDLLDEVFRKKLEQTLHQKNIYLTEVLKEEPFEFSAIFNEYLRYKNELERYVKDTSRVLYDELKKGRKSCLRGHRGLYWMWTTVPIPM